MSFPNISEFKEKLLDGGARHSLFRMELTWPQTVASGAAFGSPWMPFHCRISEIPGVSFNPITLKYAGREIKYAGSRVYQNLTLTVINDEGFTVRKAIENWMELIQSRETNVSVLTAPLSHGATGYAGTGRVIQYKKTGEHAKSYIFTDIYPVTLGNISLDWSNDSSIEDYTVEFAYQHWVPGEEFASSVVRNLTQ
jgi:hypothetical protein